MNKEEYTQEEWLQAIGQVLLNGDYKVLANSLGLTFKSDVTERRSMTGEIDYKVNFVNVTVSFNVAPKSNLGKQINDVLKSRAK